MKLQLLTILTQHCEPSILIIIPAVFAAKEFAYLENTRYVCKLIQVAKNNQIDKRKSVFIVLIMLSVNWVDA